MIIRAATPTEMTKQSQKVLGMGKQSLLLLLACEASAKAKGKGRKKGEGGGGWGRWRKGALAAKARITPFERLKFGRKMLIGRDSSRWRIVQLVTSTRV